MKPLWNVLSIPLVSSFLISTGVCNIPATLNSLKCPKHTVLSLCIKICFIHIAPSAHYSPYIFLPRWCVINFQNNSNSTLYFLCLYFPAWWFHPGTAGRLLLNLERNCLRRYTYWRKQKAIEKGCWGEEQQGEATPGNCPAARLAVLGFKGMVFSFWLSLANQLACAHIWSDSRSFLVAHASLGQDGFNSEGFWEADWHLLSAFGPSQILLVSFRQQH